MANAVSFCILVLYLYGRSLWSKNNPLHKKLMLVAFGSDLVLVTALVVGREALTKVTPEMPLSLKVHVPIAVLTVLLYIPTVWTGFQLAKGCKVRHRLILLDKFLTTSRILTFVTSLWVQFGK